MKVFWWFNPIYPVKVKRLCACCVKLVLVHQSPPMHAGIYPSIAYVSWADSWWRYYNQISKSIIKDCHSQIYWNDPVYDVSKLGKSAKSHTLWNNLLICNTQSSIKLLASINSLTTWPITAQPVKINDYKITHWQLWKGRLYWFRFEGDNYSICDCHIVITYRLDG